MGFWLDHPHKHLPIPSLTPVCLVLFLETYHPDSHYTAPLVPQMSSHLFCLMGIWLVYPPKGTGM